ncbi:MAG: radical SAM protein, partial [Lentisphaerae bacterium]|nr:radical SAM protein [Lentisphaerota bacterium]
MTAGGLDCVIVGFHDYDLDAMMAARERIREVSGAFRQMQGSVFRYRGRWLHQAGLLNAALKEATGRDYGLHSMQLPNLAVCYLYTYLVRRGYAAEFVNFYNAEQDRLAALLRRQPGVVAVTTTFYVENEPIKEVVRFVRAHSPGSRVVVGGPYILNLCSLSRPAAQDRVLAELGADIYVHDAQGEAALEKVLRVTAAGTERFEDIPNLIVRGPRDGKDAFSRTPREPEDNDMDADAIDWSLLPSALVAPTALIMLSRSCAFRCSFCRYPALAGPLRLAGVETVERQLRRLHEAGTRTLIFTDDTPNVPVKRFKALLGMMIDNGFDFAWFSNLRCADADAETYDLLKAAGCRGVFLGIESGEQRILDAMNKQATVEDYRAGIRELKARGILTYTSFIVGFPGETDESVRKTMDFIRETRPDYFQVHVYYHSRYVPIQERAREFGLRGGDYSWR